MTTVWATAPVSAVFRSVVTVHRRPFALNTVVASHRHAHIITGAIRERQRHADGVTSRLSFLKHWV
jgi:hypothetical protein